MKSVEEITATLPPKTKIFFPMDDGGVTRFNLKASKHRKKIRVVFTRFDGVDMVNAMYRQNFVTLEEMEELKRIFFPPDEWDSCVIAKHPKDKYAMILYRTQDGVFDGK